MKKIKFLSAIALTLALGACDNFDLPNPDGQKNPEPGGVFENSGLVLTPSTGTLELQAFNNANQFVPVATVSELINFPEAYTLSIDMEVGNNASFSKYTTVETVLDGNTVTVNPDFFQGAINEMISKEPKIYDVNVRFVAYAERESTRIRLGGINATYGDNVYSVKTLDPATVIEDAYYMVPFNGGTADLAGAKKMSHSGSNPYDYPDFSCDFTVTADQAATGYLWKVVPASSFDAGSLDNAFGARADDATGLSGVVGQNLTDPGVITLQGPVLLTVNMEAKTYMVNYALEMLYPFSGTVKPENMMKLHTTNFINYTGVTFLQNKWTLAGQPDKNGTVVFKQDPESTPEISEDGLTQTGILSQAADALSLGTPLKGAILYWCDVNLVLNTYSITAVQTLSVIGGGNGWDLATATPLTPSKDLRTWTANDVYFDGEFKINANGTWDLSFGSPQGNWISNMDGVIVYPINKADGGGNCEGVKGHYDVTLDFSAYPYTLTLKQKNL